ncbi:hypothetical protein CMU75_09025 [Elizabethkingia anophelis]|nr:hypothetical protein [Elizabethkingia anophelis]MDV3653259.1 hypothetical protein [Elizabethkingia anophelis]
MEFKGTKGLFTYSIQKGSKNNCFMAQVFKCNGDSIAEIESTDDPEEASANAKLFSYAPEMLEMLKVARDKFMDLKHDKNLPELQEIQEEIETLIKQATE